jgi:hypothetical protein
LNAEREHAISSSGTSTIRLDDILVKNSIICPKCKKDISYNCKVKYNYIMMSIITGNLFHEERLPHLQGAHHLNKKEFEQSVCKGKLVLTYTQQEA